MFDFNKKPFARILIPFVLGILSVLYFGFKPSTLFFLVCVLVALGALIYANKQKVIAKSIVVIIADLFLFFLGIYLTNLSQLKNQPEFYGNKIDTDSLQFIGVVNEIPLQKPKTLKVLIDLKSIKLKDKYTSSEGNIIAYLQNSSTNKTIKAGTVLLVKAKLQEVKEPLNPHVFNFKNYFNNKSIYHTCYVDSSSFLPINNVVYNKTIKQTGLAIKTSIVEKLKNNGLSKEAYTICSALITGYDDDIESSVLEAFSHSGTLHILSVSGLHVGVIYLVLIWFIRLFDRNNKFKLFQLLFVSVCLWFFALITGLSAPVLRAVIMFNLLGIGKLYFNHKSSNQINILFVSAFVMLFTKPLLILDIGFLLSYTALFGILYFYPKLNSLYAPKNTFIAKIWQSSLVSVSATITTLPITLLVFHQFPVWFVFTNLIVVPYSFMLLAFGFLSLFKIGFIIALTNKLTAVLVSFIKLFNKENYFYIDYIDFSIVDSVFLILFIYSISLLLFTRKYNFALFSLITILVWQVFSLMNSLEKKSKNELVIYHTPKSTTVSIKNKRHLLLSNTDSTNFNFSIKPYITASNYPIVKQDNFNYVKTKKFSLLIIKDKNQIPIIASRNSDYLLICNNSLPSEQFLESRNFKEVIADGSNNYYTLRKLEQLCAKFGVAYYATATQGAFIKNFN